MERIAELTVTFEIEIRPASALQKEAGKRLFNKLLKRARKSSNDGVSETSVGGAGGTAKPSPAPAPHSLSGGQIFHSQVKKSRRIR